MEVPIRPTAGSRAVGPLLRPRARARPSAEPALRRRSGLHFTGDQIRTTTTEIGTLVTVTIRLTVDAGSTSFTLLVPHVNLDQGRHAPIVTEGITTLHRFSIFPPANHGQTELYTVIPLTGTAQAVVF